MPNFRVWVSRTITESALIIIDAETKEDAEEQAMDQKLDLYYSTDDFCTPTNYTANAEEE